MVQRVPLPVQPRGLREQLARVEALHRAVPHKVARQHKGEPQHKAAQTRAEVRTLVAERQRRAVVKAQRPRRVVHKRHPLRVELDRPHPIKAVAMVPRLMAPVAARRPTRHRMTARSLRPEGLRISIVPLR